MRCKLCDTILKPAEIIWYKDRGTHEDLCCKCRSQVQQDMLENYTDSAGEPFSQEILLDD